MTTLLFDIPRPSLSIEGTSARFPVRRIFCVGRNYAEHTREMGGDPARQPPIYFTKALDALAPGGGPVPYPSITQDLHFEGELVIAIGAEGLAVSESAAERLIYGFAAGLDLTRRDMQAEAKAAGAPWDMSKSFTGAAPIGAIVPASALAHGFETRRLETTVNGAVRQSAPLGDMIYSPRQIIADLSRYDRLHAGDLIFTGTPAGVGPVGNDDRLTVSIDGVPPLSIRLVKD